MAKIVLTGANGGIGSAVLKHILPLVSPSSLVLALHNPDAAPKSLKELGARVCKADYTEPQTLDDAFQGAGVLFLLSYPSIQHQERFQMHKNAIDAAVRQGVRHIFYTSLAYGGNLESSSRAFVMQAHLSTEAYLASLAASPSHPLTYTAIREGLYSESYPLYLGFFDPSHPVDEVALPDDGNRGIAWAARYELGEATAKLIHSYAHDSTTFPYINETILLSGPEALPLSGVVEVLGRLLGRPPIRIRRTSVGEYVTKYATLGAKDRNIAQNIKEWTTVYEAIKAGECEVVTPTLEEWLGREPETFEQTIGKMIQQQQNKER